MILFKLPMYPQGPNLLSAAIYNLRGWYTLVLFPLERASVPVRLPVRVLERRNPLLAKGGKS